MRLLLLLFAIYSSTLLAGELKPIPQKPAPALVLPTLDGAAAHLDGLRGRVVLVNFWAVWCPPCRKEMPSMARLAKKMAARPFSILAVNMGDSAEDVRNFLKQVPVGFPILMDSEGENLKPWDVFAFPTSYVLDKRGRMRLGLFGSIEWDDTETVAKLEALLKEE